MTTTDEEPNGTARGPARRRGRRSGRRAAGSVAVLAVGVGSCSLLAAPAAFPQPGDGSVTVRVVRAVDTSGVYKSALEPGIAGVKVTLTDDAGVGIEGTTAANGLVTLAPATSKAGGGKYRVQVVNPKPGVLFPAFASRQGLDGAPGALSSNEEFVDLSGGKNVSYTTGLWNPGDYCQKNAPLVTTCQPMAREGGAQRTLVSFPYSARGQDGDGVSATNIATNAETGTLFGIAWNKADRRVFSTAVAKRTTGYGPGGAGGIYVTDLAQKKTTLFTTVPDAGTSIHGDGTDDAFTDAPGKESLGGIKITDDGRGLFVVNLNDRRLYRYDATAPSAGAPSAAYPIPDPGCPAAGDWRPFGLGLQDGTGYLGGVCSGESTGKLTDVRAVVLPFDLGTGVFGRPVLDQPLDYPRKSTVGSGPCDGAGWFPWTSTFPTAQGGRPCGLNTMANPEPELGEIGFETDGSMLLAFRDRFGDRAPGAPNPGAPARVMSGGDLNKACPVNGTYVLDTNGGCGLAPRGNRFFDTAWAGVGHHNTAFAGMALSKVEDTIAVSAFDPNHTALGYGTSFLQRADGKQDPKLGFRLNPAKDNAPFGKGASMGDLEVLCDRAPLQIGNRVWYDPERKGIQNPGQRPVPGATVHLYDESGKVVGTTTTTGRGEYYFDDSDVTGGLKPRTKYTIRIDNPADYAKGGPLYQWVPTAADVGDNHFIDSKGVVPAGARFPERSLTTGGPGENDHTYDFGYRRQEGVLRVVKNDQDGRPLAGATFRLWKESNGTDGLQTTGDKPDTPVGEPCTTGADGVCQGSGTPGTYYWQEVSPPDGYSAPDPSVSAPLVLTADNLDAGVSVTMVNRLIATPTPTPTPTPTSTASPTPTPVPTGTPSPSSPPAQPGPAVPGNPGNPAPGNPGNPDYPLPPSAPRPVPGTLPGTGASRAIPVAVAGAVVLTVLGSALLVLTRRRKSGR
ncbi:SdrD B-like domain-containing protein [Streptomyces sp. SP17BM10]|uniref:SdrD B-like domain-containing protein n=1 Tax=Streptomyces sp. SP17BM10 TaxID=3002530 RepID=UPI002E773BED|nr:SdrD B-like domain-containing protein [Streptomyces sp. SP17BM10]MEE1783646.1 SdrD B-like domain-containing protein [Streptomyces sp. SP17BM10]